MNNNKQSLEKMLSTWRNPPNCIPPVFPVIYMEWPMAYECRGFNQLENLIGDFDFVGYHLHGDDILIDSSGNIFKLMFKDFVIPGSLIGQLSVKELKENLMPALTYLKDMKFINEISNEAYVENIISKVADKFFW